MPLILSGSSGLSGNVGTTTKEMLPAGTVLQVQQARKTDTWSTSSTGFQPISDMAISVTPLNTNSKFLIEVSLFVGAYWWGSNGGYMGLSVNGASSPLLGNGASPWTLQYGADTGNSPYETIQWTDSTIISPNSTAVQTFIPMLASYNSSYAIYLNRSYNNNYGTQGRSTITVTEIKG
jgi:hypothetical protein